MARTKKKPQKPTDTFEAVAERLGCDPNLKAFDKKLGKSARTQPTSGSKGPKANER